MISIAGVVFNREESISMLRSASFENTTLERTREIIRTRFHYPSSLARPPELRNSIINWARASKGTALLDD